VSEEFLRSNLKQTLNAAGYATIKAMQAWSATDFRSDLTKIKIPLLVLHGRADETVPIDISGEETVKQVSHAEYVVYDDAPHGLFYTHKHKFNEDLLTFISGNRIIEFDYKA
jgi:pimeloyl-ACP methyl ester carboxylesterase